MSAAGATGGTCAYPSPSDAIGILELVLPHRPENDVVEYLESAAHALAYVAIASRRHTDVFEWSQRDTPFSLAAEIQRRLLPSSYSVEAEGLVLAGWLEPASNVRGVNIEGILESTAARHPREIVGELAAHVLRETGGELRDDATVLCLDWYGAEDRRHAVAGASRTRAAGGRRPSCGTSHEQA